MSEYTGAKSLTRQTRLVPNTIGLRQIAIGSVVFVLFAGFMGVVQFATPNLIGTDGYYHIKIASLMRSSGLLLEFPWLPLTILNATEFVDHHFLFHVLLIPFTLGDLVFGAKLASILFASAAFLTVWWLLYSQKVPGAFLWALGTLAVSEAFIFRMSMPRAQSLSLMVLVLSLHWMLTGKHRMLLPLAFLYVWLYDAFPLILLVAGAFAVVHWILHGRQQLKPLAYAGLGVGLGLLIHPYFPDNLIFLSRHILPKLIDPASVNVGSEWYPYETVQLLQNSGLALAAFMSGVLALGINPRRMSVRTGTALIMSIVLGLMLFQSRRFVEYFPPSALIFAAFAWAPIVRRWQPQTAESERGGEVEMVRLQRGTRPRRLTAKLLVAGLSAALLIGLWSNLQASRDSVMGSKSSERYGAASTWLKEHTAAGSRVFQTDWDDFPRLFFFNSHNTYTLGLDPTYMQIYDSDLYELWVDLTQGQSEDLSGAIQDSFGAVYAITDLKHTGFLRAAEDDSRLIEVYSDEYAVIFEITESDTQ